MKIKWLEHRDLNCYSEDWDGIVKVVDIGQIEEVSLYNKSISGNLIDIKFDDGLMADEVSIDYFEIMEIY